MCLHFPEDKVIRVAEIENYSVENLKYWVATSKSEFLRLGKENMMFFPLFKLLISIAKTINLNEKVEEIYSELASY